MLELAQVHQSTYTYISICVYVRKHTQTCRSFSCFLTSSCALYTDTHFFFHSCSSFFFSLLFHSQCVDVGYCFWAWPRHSLQDGLDSAYNFFDCKCSNGGWLVTKERCGLNWSIMLAGLEESWHQHVALLSLLFIFSGCFLPKILLQYIYSRSEERGTKRNDEEMKGGSEGR